MGRKTSEHKKCLQDVNLKNGLERHTCVPPSSGTQFLKEAHETLLGFLLIFSIAVRLAFPPTDLKDQLWKTPGKNTFSQLKFFSSKQFWKKQKNKKLNNSNFYFGVPKSVLLDIYIKRSQQFFSPLLTVNKLSLWDCRWVKDAVSAKLHEKVRINFTSARLLYSSFVMNMLLGFHSGTSVWNHHKGFCWEIPSCRS